MQCVFSSHPHAAARPAALILPPTLTNLPDATASLERSLRWLSGP
ncbi:hypothetical protein ACFSYD_22365 [Paracoccus aerius]